ncbi:MAG: ribonucleotide reductase N-terminal alpha domain-containing protein [Candidatus Kaelpia imicola]|nr:ribonucleotide reductase N-terminal alpha domain-containing protein [Candidatus Kaelpia imicola]
MSVALTQNALKVLERRYLTKNSDGQVVETPEKMFERVAEYIASADKNYAKSDREVEATETSFYDMMSSLEFMPNSPTLMNAGRPLAQLSACFVLPIDDSINSIFETLKAAALIHQSGGGTGFDFSRLRPKNSRVCSTDGVSSGPISFMKVYNAATQEIKQGGRRRGANMGILRVDHPEIMEFITAKDNNKEITNFNISIAITDEFMKALEEGGEYELRDPRDGRVTQKLKAEEVFDLIVKQAWKNGEPGIVFIDKINEDNPTPNIGRIESTNPCVDGDTLVSTEKGLVRIKDIAFSYPQGGINILNDEVVLETHGEGNLMLKTRRKCSLNRISKAFRSGVKPVYKISTESGYELVATADHKIYTQDGWVEIGDLKPDYHKVYIQLQEGQFSSEFNLPFEIKDEYKGCNGRTYKFNFPKKWSKELGEAIGWIVGDGWVIEEGKDCRIGLTFGKEDIDVLEYLKQVLNGYYGEDIKEVKRKESVYHLSYHSKYFVDFFKSLDIRALKAEHKKVPEPIFTAPRQAVIGFLRGLFGADGTVAYNHSNSMRYARLTSKSLRLIKEVQVLLLNLGIKSRVYDRSRAERYGFKYLNKNGEEKQYLLDGKLYELNISRKSLKIFLDKVGFIGRKHQDLVSELMALDYYADKYEENVKRIEYVGEREVYDLTEPFTHSFIANGIVISNCGEQPLLPYESCNLGSINLSRMIKEENGEAAIDWERLRVTAHRGVHFLDNVIDKNQFPLPEIEKQTKRTRKIGLGVMGWADMLIKLGIGYNSDDAVSLAKEVMGFILNEAMVRSQELAAERGVFLAYEGSVWDKKGIKMRNATLTTIAPTGTISIISDCSSGIEPLFALVYTRHVMDNDRLLKVNPEFEKVSQERGFYSEKLIKDIAVNGGCAHFDNIPDETKKIFVTAHDVKPEWHIRMQAAFQKFVHNATSKTVNFPNAATLDDVRDSYLLAYKLGCKGATIYRDKSREEQVINIGDTTSESGIKEIPDNMQVVFKPRPRPKVLRGTTTNALTGCGTLYVTINEDEEGNIFEVFMQMGKSGGCAASQLEAIGRLISTSIRAGVDPEAIIKQLKGIRCPSPSWEKGGTRIFSCADAIARVVEDRIREKEVQKKIEGVEEVKVKIPVVVKGKNVVGVCPDCGNALIHEEGCLKCMSCGYSKC